MMASWIGQFIEILNLVVPWPQDVTGFGTVIYRRVPFLECLFDVMIPTFSVLVPVCFFPSFAIGVHLRRQLIRFRTRQTTSTLFGLPMLFDYVFYLRPYKGVK